MYASERSFLNTEIFYAVEMRLRSFDPLSEVCHRREVRCVVRLATDADVVSLQGIHGGRVDSMELVDFLPTFTFAGSVGRAFADRYVERTLVEVVRGRIVVLGCRGPGIPPLDIANMNLRRQPLQLAAQLAWLATR